jgi:hypothetical protein
METADGNGLVTRPATKCPVGFRKLSQLLPVPYWNVLITQGIAPVWERWAYVAAGNLRGA